MPLKHELMAVSQNVIRRILMFFYGDESITYVSKTVWCKMLGCHVDQRKLMWWQGGRRLFCAEERACLQPQVAFGVFKFLLLHLKSPHSISPTKFQLQNKVLRSSKGSQNCNAATNQPFTSFLGGDNNPIKRYYLCLYAQQYKIVSKHVHLYTSCYAGFSAKCIC